jgi:hypothetical protein
MNRNSAHRLVGPSDHGATVDPKQFDSFARALGSGRPRRAALRTLARGALGVIAVAVGIGEAGASVKKRGMGVVCSKHADCESRACYPKDRTGRRTFGPNLCLQTTSTPLDDCHLTGVCEPTTGVCSNPTAADGSFCHRFSGTCGGGVCNLFSTLSCEAGSQCESQCPSSSDQYCYCGTTIEGDPACYRADHGCDSSECTSSENCGAGSSCINLTGGCGGCQHSVCNVRCTS